MKRADAERRIKALVDFHEAVGAVLKLTDFADDGFGRRATRPKPGRVQEWRAAKATADRLAPKAARSYDIVNATVSFKPSGTWNRYPVNPATQWATVLSDDPMFGLDLFETMTNQAIGAYEDAIEDPPKRQRSTLFVSAGGVSKWLAVVVGTIIATLAATGLAVWIGWI